MDCRQTFYKHYCTLCENQHIDIDNELFALPLSGTLDTPCRSEVVEAHREINPDSDSPRDTSSTLIIPGLLGDSVSAIVAPFLMARRALDVKGYCTQIAWVNGRRGCDYNADILRKSILEEVDATGKPVNIIAYSKGCADVLHMLAKHPDTHKPVAALVSYAGVVRGSPLADNASWIARTLLQYAPLPGDGYGDGLAINNLTTTFRQQWLQDNPLPHSIRYASFVAAPKRDRISRVLRSSYDKLASISGHNDSQVLTPDAVLPNSELLAIVNADHWALALPVEHRLPLLSRTLIDRNQFPRRLILRTIIDYLNSEPVSVSA